MDLTWLFGPFMIASIVISLIGIYVKKPYFLIISAILVVPISLYLASTPKFSLWGIVFPLFYVAGAISLKKQKTWLPILFSIPVYLLILWFGYVVVNPEPVNYETITEEQQVEP
ncbi:hypothetical protein [Bacillus cereus group sp. BfR-BA-01383]|uniref:hypothetical protein n=1 Tax=Bacillus cereus group sp. BfR-BA-01383 TaxID=2920327 RepID=UPI001F58DDEB|nr:hypothetical protein [Bacillus cereus group sp. BfR-BA-01383]